VMSLTTGILLSIAFLQFHDQRNLGGWAQQMNVPSSVATPPNLDQVNSLTNQYYRHNAFAILFFCYISVIIWFPHQQIM
jgi:hypothetical protein